MTYVEKLNQLLNEHQKMKLSKYKICAILNIPVYIFDAHRHDNVYACKILKELAKCGLDKPLESNYKARIDTTAELRESVLWLIKEKGWQFADIYETFAIKPTVLEKILYSDEYDADIVDNILEYVNIYANGNFQTKLPTAKQSAKTTQITDFLEEVLNGGKEESSACEEREAVCSN